MIKPKEGAVAAVRTRLKKTRTVVSAAKKKTTAIRSAAKAKSKKPHSPHKTNPADVLGKSIAISTAHTEGIERKIKIVERISSRVKGKQLTAQKTSLTPSLAEFKTQLHLALMTPFKGNVDHSQIVSNVARYAGVAFTVIGGFLTLYNMNAFATFVESPIDAQTAQTVSTCIPGTYCPSTPTTPSGPIDATPDVDIRVESSSSLLTSVVPIAVTVGQATRVDLVAVEGSTNRTLQLGTATKLNDLVWRTYWQTAAYEDGEYRLRAIVTNQHGTYTEEDSTLYSIENHPLEEPVTSGTGGAQTGTTGNASASTSEGVAPTTDVGIRVELGMSEPLRGITQLRTYTAAAQSVRHFAKLKGASTFTLLGGAALHSADEWRYSFNTTLLADGEYTVRTQVIRNDGTSENNTIDTVEIRNHSETNQASTSAENTEVSTGQESELNENLEPDIRLELTKQNPLRDTVDMYTHVLGASFVEFFVLPERSLTPRFLGLGAKQSDSTWRFRFDSKTLPNGRYLLYVNVRHLYGDSQSERLSISVENSANVTPETDDIIIRNQSADEAIKMILPPTTIIDLAENKEELKTGSTSVAVSTDAYGLLVDDIGDEYIEDIDRTLKQFTEKLGHLMKEYSTALRTNDDKRVREILVELEQLRDRIVNELPEREEGSNLQERIKEYLDTVAKDLRERTERSETIIKERLGTDATKDSDNDGITDYDEVSLYKTDPKNVDTDNDGFIDGVEILGGYDPLDASRESNLVFESPKEFGTVRDDILSISHVTTIVDEGSGQPKAHIGGTALPNSFVTLYIFSTPIIVTVKTDEHGNWSYIFDKEIENGEHKVYVGMTDNAGRIIAKSNPLPFIKTAEAFTPIGAPAVVAVAPPEPSLLTNRALLTIGSVAVVALGLVLILLGLHVRPREKVSLEFAKPAL